MFYSMTNNCSHDGRLAPSPEGRVGILLGRLAPNIWGCNISKVWHHK